MTERDGLDPETRDLARATQTLTGQLIARDVRLNGNEPGAQLADLLTVVERFESAVARRGGDSISNAPDSRTPYDLRFVLPRRRDNESVTAYAARVRAATDRLAGDA